MLDELFSKYNSDKGDKAPPGVPPGQFHCYGAAYEKYFTPLRVNNLTLLEIGVSIHGDSAPSLMAWKEFFPNAYILGMDIYDYTMFESERVHVEVGNQGKIEDLERVSLRHGPFDIIIDDGSHYAGHQLVSFMKLFNSLKPDGIYVVEDLHIPGAMPWSSNQEEAGQFTTTIAQLVNENIITAEYFNDKWGCFQIVFIKKVKENPSVISATMDDDSNLIVAIKKRQETDGQQAI